MSYTPQRINIGEPVTVDKNSSAEERTLERIAAMFAEDQTCQTFRMLLLANPEPSSGKDEEKAGKPQPIDFADNVTPAYVQYARSLRKVSLKRRIMLAASNLLTYYDVTHALERKLCIGEEDEKKYYFFEGKLVDAAIKKNVDDRYSDALKRLEDLKKSGQAAQDAKPMPKGEFRLLGAQEIGKMRRLIADELTEVLPNASEELWTLLRGPKSSYVYNISEIKIVEFNPTFVEMCCDFISVKFLTVANDFNTVYDAYVGSNVWFHSPADGRKGEKIAKLATKLMDAVIALISRLDSSKTLESDQSVGPRVASLIAQMGYVEPFLKFSDIKTDNLELIMLEVFRSNRRVFYQILLDLAQALKCDASYIRSSLIRAALDGRQLYSVQAITSRLSNLRESGLASNRMINAFFSAVNVENLSVSHSSRKKLPVFRGPAGDVNFEDYFMRTFTGKMTSVNEDVRDPKTLAYVVSRATYDKWIRAEQAGDSSASMLRQIYDGSYRGNDGRVFLPAVSDTIYGYEQKFTMSLISAAKTLGANNKPIEAPEQIRAQVYDDIEALLLAVGLYKQANLARMAQVEQEQKDNKKALQNSQPFYPQQDYSAHQIPSQQFQAPQFGTQFQQHTQFGGATPGLSGVRSPAQHAPSHVVHHATHPVVLGGQAPVVPQYNAAAVVIPQISRVARRPVAAVAEAKLEEAVASATAVPVSHAAHDTHVSHSRDSSPHQRVGTPTARANPYTSTGSPARVSSYAAPGVGSPPRESNIYAAPPSGSQSPARLSSYGASSSQNRYAAAPTSGVSSPGRKGYGSYEPDLSA